jgi:uncharacterized SAM-binding protein YcdF (DUF218 family)
VLARWVGFAIGGLSTFGALLFLAGDVYEYTDSYDGGDLPDVDAIVCLGGGRGRIAASGDLWFRFFEKRGPEKTPVLYFAGLGPKAGWSTIRSQVREGVLKALKPSRVIIETESLNTEENAKLLIPYAKRFGWRRILLLTSRYHMKRASFIFSKVFEHLPAESAFTMQTLSIVQEPFEPGEWRESFQGVRITVQEYLKGLYYFHFWVP